MKRKYYLLLTVMIVSLLVGCSRDTAEKIRYDMEKLSYMAGKLAERMNIQPQLATSSDSLALKTAYEKIIGYYQDNRENPLIAGDDKVKNEMSRMAIVAQLKLAGYYTSKRQADSVIAAYRRIGTDIPAGQDDILGAKLALALTFRALTVFDSTIAIYDGLLREYYPPLDSLGRINTDIAAIPIDKIKIAQAIEEKDRVARYTREGQEYFDRLRREFPDNKALIRRATVNASRVYSMTEQWDNALTELNRITDSTGQVDVAALVLVANIYNGPKNNINRAIEIYQQILDREPDSMIIGSTMLQLGMAQCGRDDHEEGRKTLAELKKKFSMSSRLVSKAQFYYAQSFETQGRWDRALSEYQWLMENYPYAEEAFWAARRIPEHFAGEDNQKMAETWYERAAEFYQRAANIKQGQPIEMAANTYLAEIYRITKQWNKALEVLEKIHSLAPRTQLAARALYNAASVAYKEMGDSAMAQNYLNRLNREFGTTDSTQIYEDKKTEINLESLE